MKEYLDNMKVEKQPKTKLISISHNSTVHIFSSVGSHPLASGAFKQYTFIKTAITIIDSQNFEKSLKKKKKIENSENLGAFS